MKCPICDDELDHSNIDVWSHLRWMHSDDDTKELLFALLELLAHMDIDTYKGIK